MREEDLEILLQDIGVKIQEGVKKLQDDLDLEEATSDALREQLRLTEAGRNRVEGCSMDEKCCYLYLGRFSCRRPAELAIYGNEGFEDDTYGCFQHAGMLFGIRGSGPWAGTEWIVRAIREERHG